MAVSFVAAGAIASGTGNISPALPAGYAVGDVLLLTIESLNTEAVATPTGWYKVDGTPLLATGATDPTRLTCFWRRAASLSEAAPTVTDPGDHAIGRMLAFRGCTPIGVPWDVISTTTDLTGAGATKTIAGPTTTVDGCMIAIVAATGTDGVSAANSTAFFSSWTNAGLTSLTEQTDDARIDGNGGAVGVATGQQALKGAVGNTTVTVVTAASMFASLVIAFMPAVTPSVNGNRTVSPQGATEAGTFDVVAYGADRTGTSDATVAFQAAVDAAGVYGANVAGSIVMIPPGSYKIQGRVRVKPNITFSAYGAYIFGGTDYGFPGNIMFVSTGSTGYDGGCDNVTVHGGIWDAKGQNCAQSGAGTGDANHRDIFCFGNSRNWRFDDCTFRNVPSWHALDVNSVDGLTVNRCRFEGFVDKSELGTRTDSEAIQLDTGGDGSPCLNVVVTDCYSGPPVDNSGLTLAPGKLIGSHTPSVANIANHTKIRVANNYINTCGGAAIQGYDWDGATITGNVIESPGGDGIKIYGNSLGAVNRIVITGNVINSPGARGIYMSDSAGNGSGNGFSACIVNGNTITNGSNLAAIEVQAYNDGVVQGNEILNLASGHGIYARQCTDALFGNNNIHGGSAMTAGSGIQCDVGTRCHIQGNKLREIADHGIYTSGVNTDTVVEDNFIFAAGRKTNLTAYAIQIGGSACINPVIAGNLIRKFGSGNEVTQAVHVTTLSTGVIQYGNDDGGLGFTDLASGNPSAVESRGATEAKLIGARAYGLSADATTTSVTPANKITSDVLPAGTYALEAQLMWKNSLTSTAANIAYATSGTASSFVGSCDYSTSATAFNNTITAALTTAVSMTPAATSTTRSARYCGRVVLSAGGTISVTLAVSSVTGTPTATLVTGSTLTITPCT